jgi:hypothetical protein
MKNKFTPKATAFLLFSMLLFARISCYAQDTLVKRDGQQLIGKVLEVSTTEVKYKKAELPDGPMYTEEKSAIAQIKYQGGYVDTFQEIKKSSVEKSKNEDDYRAPVKNSSITRMGSYYKYNENLMKEQEMQNILLKVNDPEINLRVKSARTSKALRYIGFAAIPLAVGSAVLFSLVNFSQPANTSVMNMASGALAGSVILLGGSIYFNVNHKVQNSKAINVYNQKYAGQNAYR